MDGKDRMELCELFRYTARMRGETAETLGAKLGVSAETAGEWEYGIGLSDGDCEKIKAYASYDTVCFRAFVEQFENTHKAVTETISEYVRHDEKRLRARIKLGHEFTKLKVIYNALNAYEKKYIMRGFRYFLKFEKSSRAIRILYNDEAGECKKLMYEYYRYFMRAQYDINNLMKLYGLEKRVTLGECDEALAEAIGEAVWEEKPCDSGERPAADDGGENENN